MQICGFALWPAFVRPPPSSQAQSCEAEQHHRPRRGFRNFPDEECKVLVRPAPPRPFVAPLPHAEAEKGLGVVGRRVRQGTARDVTPWHPNLVVKIAKDADKVSAAAIG